MTMYLIEETKHSKVRVSLKELPAVNLLIASWIVKFGGKELERNKRNVCFEINTDLLNSKRRQVTADA